MFPDRTRRGEFPQRYLNPLVILFLGVLASTGHAFADTATLTWNGVSEASGYRISYGTASRNYTNTLDVGNNTQGIVTGLTSGTTYYFAVRAYDSSRISDFSQEVSGVVGGSSGGDTGGSNSSGLVAAFGFEESSGTTVFDASGNGNNGTLSNATRTTQGRFGRALSFNGSNSLVSVGDSNSLDLTDGMTLAAWVYPTTQASDFKSIITKEMSGGLTYALHAFSPRNGPNMQLFIAGNSRWISGGQAIPTSAWTHLAATHDGARQDLYVNGVRVSGNSLSGNLGVTANPLRIGGNTVNAGRYFAGVIDEVRIYNRALSQAEIATVSDEAIVK
jgi:hypothetical protein